MTKRTNAPRKNARKLFRVIARRADGKLHSTELEASTSVVARGYYRRRHKHTIIITEEIDREYLRGME